MFCLLAQTLGQTVTQERLRDPTEMVLHECTHVRAVASVVSDSMRPCGLQPARLLCPCYTPGKNTGVGCRAHLQGIFPTQVLNSRLLSLPALAGRLLPTRATWEA